MNRKHNRICLWGMPRSGSTYLFYNLVEHAMQDWWDPKFNTDFNQRKKGSEPFRCDIENVLIKFQQEKYWFAKLLDTDIINLKNSNVLQEFCKLSDYNILILRKDIFASVISLCVATIKNQWTNDQDTTRIHVPVKLFDDMLSQQQSCMNLLNDMDFDYIIYTEDLTDNFGDTWEKLTGETAGNVIENRIAKSPDVMEIVDNYDELRDYYKNITTGTYCVLADNAVHIDVAGNIKMCCDQANLGTHVNEMNVDTAFRGKEFSDVRENMKNGVRDPVCNSCWNLEDLGLQSSRTRMNRTYTRDGYEMGLYDGYVKFWDIRDSNLCNMSCRICGSYSSSLWNTEAHNNKTNSDYIMPAFGDKPVLSWESDAYKLFVNNLDKCVSVYFAGGEPLLNNTHWNMLKTLYDNEMWHVHIRYNTNLMKTKYNGNDAINMWKNFRNISISVSVDAVGELAEYARTGTNWQVLQGNIKELARHHKLQANITTSILTIHELDKTIQCLKDIGVDDVYYFNVLTTPKYMSVNILPPKYKQELWDKLNLRQFDINPDLGYNQLKRILFENPPDSTILRKRFMQFNSVLDDIRHTSLEKVNKNLWRILHETN